MGNPERSDGQTPVTINDIDALPQILAEHFSPDAIQNIQIFLRDLNPAAAEWFLKSLNKVVAEDGINDEDIRKHMAKFITTMVNPEHANLKRHWENDPALLSFLEDIAVYYLLWHIEHQNESEIRERDVWTYDFDDYCQDMAVSDSSILFHPQHGVIDSAQDLMPEEMDEALNIEGAFRKYPDFFRYALPELVYAVCADHFRSDPDPNTTDHHIVVDGNPGEDDLDAA